MNGDNNISKKEMLNYFMNANSQEMTKEFLHEFQEESFFSPHNCVYCTGFLWGVKNGFKCKVSVWIPRFSSDNVNNEIDIPISNPAQNPHISLIRRHTYVT